jgi:group I intron endonuclease
MFHLYLITNAVNGKLYVGQTCNLAERWRQHKQVAMRGDGTNRPLANAMRKYGLENFVFTHVDTFTTAEEVDAAEIAMIARLNALSSQHGYNISKGGRGNDARAAARWGAAVRYIEKFTSDERERELFEKHSAAIRKHIDRLSPEERKARMAAPLKALTTERRSEITAKRNAETDNWAMKMLMKMCHAHMACLTAEELHDIGKRCWANASDDMRQRHSESLQLAAAFKTPEERAQINRKGKETLGPEGRSNAVRKANETIGRERRRAIKLKRWANVSVEDRREHMRTAIEGKQAAWLAKPEEERREIMRTRGLRAVNSFKVRFLNKFLGTSIRFDLGDDEVIAAIGYEIADYVIGDT